MDEPQTLNDDRLVAYLAKIANAGIYNAARGFSGMLGQELSVVDQEIKFLPLQDITSIVTGLEEEVVGIYLRSEGELASQFMLLVQVQQAMELVDLLMDQPAGTSTELKALERSALAEVGNLTASFFMNSLAANTGISLRPTPPAVMVDMAGAIIDIIIATTGGLSDSVMMMKAKFILGGREVQADFWILPDARTLQLLSARV